MTDQIKPRIIAGVGLCDAGCPQILAGDDWSRCGVDDRYVYPSDPSPCHVHARSVSAERDALSDWARGALDDLIAERDAGGTCDHWILDLIETYPPDADEEVTP